jgi:putative hydrolases of HD superfamily
MINKTLLLKLFDAAYMQRWNDKLRPMNFIELDKQAHKMFIAYFLGKFEEDNKEFDWIQIIEGGIFEFLQRLVITDIKPTIFSKIKEDKAKYREFNEWIYTQIKPFIISLGEDFCKRFYDYFNDGKENINKKILNAAHLYSSKWEFDFIERVNPNGYDVDFIKKDFEVQMEKFYDLEGLKQLALYNSYRKFIDLCGQLRFQIRWANHHRIPKTSVIGHSLFVAVFSYLFSLETGSCFKRKYNNYFTGLFHDLPEVLTRDIISPVKKSIEGLSDLIKKYEVEMMNKIFYPLIPESFKDEIGHFTENEFDNFVFIEGKRKKISSEEISSKYNQDIFNPRDGELVKAVDELGAFIEATAAIENGSKNEEFKNAINIFKEKYVKKITICGIDFRKIYNEFE